MIVAVGRFDLSHGEPSPTPRSVSVPGGDSMTVTPSLVRIARPVPPGVVNGTTAQLGNCMGVPA
ncbi:hypothetical protein AS032_08865 [Rhodococcus qingshengii]|nr:hypothetical protein AS032_08865 [Rhodococcus qingshengii]OFE06584.1 hypothetical protein A5N83_22330 [Rhodococcus sp. 1139]OMQ32382.1 hypothetical protein BK799_18035 [Rhodococcus sp. D-1]